MMKKQAIDSYPIDILINGFSSPSNLQANLEEEIDEIPSNTGPDPKIEGYVVRQKGTLEFTVTFSEENLQDILTEVSENYSEESPISTLSDAFKLLFPDNSEYLKEYVAEILDSAHLWRKNDPAEFPNVEFVPVSKMKVTAKVTPLNINSIQIQIQIEG
jgi:hypothetical protein